jgi:Nuf2 family
MDMALNRHQQTVGGPAAAANQHTNFVFPLLKSGEILECLSELELEMKTQELKDPSSHKQKLRQAWIHLVRVHNSM